MRIDIVGLGFLGSWGAELIVKRLLAGDIFPDIVLWDPDIVDDRNWANQNFTKDDEGRYKVDVVARRLEGYGIKVTANREKIESWEQVKGTDLAVVLTDNLVSREEIWKGAVLGEYHMVTASLSRKGTGRAQWTFKDLDTFSLSPRNRIPGQKLEEEDVKEPPCELIKYTGLGLNTVIALARAVGIWAGVDPEETAEFQGMTTWISGNEFHKLVD